jgi:hypothetical protein
MFGKHFGGIKQRLRKKRCFNVPNIVPTFVPIGNYCPIIFVRERWIETIELEGWLLPHTSLHSLYELNGILYSTKYVLYGIVLYSI